MGFFSRLESRVREIDSLLCVGLDPHPDDLEGLTAEAVRDFCLRLVEATADMAAAFKPNAAFFEALGPEGVTVLKEVITAVPEGIPVILDGKRGDIASTAEAYARAAFEVFGADAVTVNPYLGYDAIAPFLLNPVHGVFLLCKTSNPGAGDFQDLVTGGGDMLYEVVARRAGSWSQRDNLGLVVGATQPEALQRVRNLVPGLWILAPGLGAQGGDVRAALNAGLRSDGLGLLLPVSRAISRASNPAQAAREWRDAINNEREGSRISSGVSWEAPETVQSTLYFSLADDLLASGCIKFGQFTLKSGLQSPIYIDLRQLASHPGLLAQVAAAYLPLLEQLTFDRLAALPYAALPIATAISLKSGWPFVYPRKETKTYGTGSDVEGEFSPGERVVVIDDLATTGGSKFEAIEKLAAAGLQVSDVVVLIDRQSGAAEALAQAGYRLQAVFTLTQLLDYWEQAGKVSAGSVTAVRDFLARGNQI